MTISWTEMPNWVRMGSSRTHCHLCRYRSWLRQALGRAGDLNLEHGHETHVAVVIGVGRDGIVHVVEALAVGILELPLAVVEGPVEDVLGVAQVVGVSGCDLELDLDQLVVGQIVDSQRKRVLGGEGLDLVGDIGLGGEIG